MVLGDSVSVSAFDLLEIFLSCLTSSGFLGSSTVKVCRKNEDILPPYLLSASSCGRPGQRPG